MKTSPRIRQFVASRIKEARELAEIDQGQLARQLGVKRTTVSMIEQGHNALTVEGLVEIARITGREVGYFLPGRPDLVAALRAAYPNLTMKQIDGIIRYVAFEASPESYRRGGSSDIAHDDETSTVDTPNTKK